MTPPSLPEALIFDVFGTCVDWRTAVAREAAAAIRAPDGAEVDWLAFADAWRARYQPQMETVRSGRRPWVKLPVLNREALDEVLDQFRLADALPAPERDRLNGAWCRLDPWPDVPAGLARLRERFLLAPCSNADVASGVRLARFARLPWDTILGSEVARDFKPKPAVYRDSVAALGLEPGAVMMVAAHNNDLVAAAAQGLRTAFVARPTEHGPAQTTDLRAEHPFDVVARDFADLADQLGA